MPLFVTDTNFIPFAAMDVDGTFSANSDFVVPTQKAARTYVGNRVPLQLYRNGTLKTAPKTYMTTGTVASGTVTFNLTDDNTATGNALFSTIYKESLNWWIDDAANQYQVGGYTVAGNLKTLTLTINRLGTVILGLIQFTVAANGTTVNITVWGE